MQRNSDFAAVDTLFSRDETIDNQFSHSEKNASLIALQRVCEILLSETQKIDYHSIAKVFGFACGTDQAGIVRIVESEIGDLITESAAVWLNSQLSGCEISQIPVSEILRETQIGQNWIEKLAIGQLVTVHNLPADSLENPEIQTPNIASLVLAPCLVDENLAACIYICNQSAGGKNQQCSPDLLDLQPRQAIADIDFIQMCARTLGQGLTSAKQRKANLAARDLLEREKRLESLGVLAGGIAHDYNNLLTVILGSSELILSEVDPESSVHYLAGEIKHASLRARDLTSKMVNYSGNCKLVFEPTEINKVVTLCVQKISQSLPANIDISTKLAPIENIIIADSKQIAQAIENLILNAKEAIGGKPGKIEIKTELVEVENPAELENLRVGEISPGTYIKVSVKDTGCGITDMICEKLFDPFFSTKFLGRGLGLPAVYGIVKSHTGAILVKSLVGAGSNFQIMLPVEAR